MTKTPAWRRYLRFWGAIVDDDVDDELRFHIEMRVDEYVARGMTEDEARRAVMERLGDLDAARAECIELGKVREKHARQADFLSGLSADVRFAFRSLRRSPGWTAVALLTIALGIGATTAVFSVADALLVRPIPYPDASRVFIVRRAFTVDGQTAFAGIPYAAVQEWRDHASMIEDVAPFSRGAVALGTGTDTMTVHASEIDTAFLTFAGARPLIGRDVTAEEMAPGGPGAVLLSEQFWRRQYGGSHDVVGKVVQLGDRARTIVGVLPASLAIPDYRTERADVFIPLAPAPHLNVPGVLVRLKAGVSPEAAIQQLDAIFEHAGLGYGRGPVKMQLLLTRPQDTLAIRQALVMLTGAVALLLLVACTNIAHLLLARGAARQRELAVRHALGAGRSRLLRQLVTETVVLALFGGALALFVGWAGLHLLAAVRPAKLVALTYVSTNRGILSLTSVLAIVCGLAIGLLAALRIAHRDIAISLRAGASSTSLRGRRLRASLVVGEVALSTTLLVGALLLIHAVFDLQRTHLGFDARGLYALSISASEKVAPAERMSLAMLLRERASRIPGVEDVTLAQSEPSPRGFAMLGWFETPEHPAVGEMRESTGLNSVAPDYFSTLGMPLLAGHTFDEGSLTRNEVIISRTLAHQLWPEGSAIGHRFRNAVPRPDGSVGPWSTVIGVVPDIVENLIGGTARPELYRPLDPENDKLTLIIRLQGDNPSIVLKDLTASIPPGRWRLAIKDVRQGIDESIAEPRFTMRVLAGFASLGVLLAAVGLFGVISYDVGQRTREIGVRMTLGATRGGIARLVVGDGVRLALLGIATGLLGAVAATRLIQNLLYGVSRLDPFAFGFGAALLLAVSLAACVVPMLRATGVDPVIAVRSE